MMGITYPRLRLWGFVNLGVLGLGLLGPVAALAGSGLKNDWLGDGPVARALADHAQDLSLPALTTLVFLIVWDNAARAGHALANGRWRRLQQPVQPLVLSRWRVLVPVVATMAQVVNEIWQRYGGLLPAYTPAVNPWEWAVNLFSNHQGSSFDVWDVVWIAWAGGLSAGCVWWTAYARRRTGRRLSTRQYRQRLVVLGAVLASTMVVAFSFPGNAAIAPLTLRVGEWRHHMVATVSVASAHERHARLHLELKWRPGRRGRWRFQKATSVEPLIGHSASVAVAAKRGDWEAVVWQEPQAGRRVVLMRRQFLLLPS